MSKRARQKSSGDELFNNYFSELYGQRWSQLLTALNGENKKISLDIMEGCMAIEPYELDLASKLAADTLPIDLGDKILDMCAAPGGKSLCLIARTQGQSEVVLNEYSKNRIGRLKRVVKEYVPESWQSLVNIKNHDASKWGLFEQNVYDAILLDVPCSGERHLLENKSELSKWSEKRSKRLAQRQYALLCAAVMAAKEGGHILYSTCSINPVENDQVIQKYIDKKKNIKIISIEKEIGEPTGLGWQLLPDTADGWGPLYFCLLQKN